MSTVLVIEDNHDIAESLSLILTIAGHEVQNAYTGADGVRIGRSWQPDFILCDIGLPGLDGYGVADQLRLGLVTSQLIAVTAYGSDDDRQRTKRHGFKAHFVKPADPAELLHFLACC